MTRDCGARPAFPKKRRARMTTLQGTTVALEIYRKISIYFTVDKSIIITVRTTIYCYIMNPPPTRLRNIMVTFRRRSLHTEYE